MQKSYKAALREPGEFRRTNPGTHIPWFSVLSTITTGCMTSGRKRSPRGPPFSLALVVTGMNITLKVRPISREDKIAEGDHYLHTWCAHSSRAPLGAERGTPTWSLYPGDNSLTQIKTCCGGYRRTMGGRHTKAFVPLVTKGLGGMSGGALGPQEE